ncbi:MAG TPA: 6-phosphogluconolactonase [Gemmatimonadales bacterium]|nr:6-phosphogluconolactonase [Gemmatimonadales bacterium]
MSSRNVLVEDPHAFPRRAAEWLAETMTGVLAARRQCAIALSGGRTPGPVYGALAASDLSRRIDWSRVDVFFADERAVPPDDAESNYRLLQETLLTRVGVPKPQVHRMQGESPDLDAAAAVYARELPATLDVLVLGMGADGHTASLFPGSPAILERRRHVMAVESPKPPHRRITITPPVIAAARHVVVLVTGRDKASAVARVFDGDAVPTVVPAVLARPPRGVWFLDSAAAALLPRPVA